LRLRVLQRRIRAFGEGRQAQVHPSQTRPLPGLYQSDSQSTLAEMQWLFVGVVYDDTDLKLFIDGTQDASGTFAAAQVDSDQPVRIGFELIISGDPGYLSGLVDDVRIYKRALSDGEIQQLYQP